MLLLSINVTGSFCCESGAIQTRTAVDKSKEIILQKASNVSLHTELLKASKEGDYSSVVRLLVSEVSVNITGEHDFTPLHLAARGGHIDVIISLLDAKANIQAPNKNSNTPLHSAAYGDQPQAINVLLERGAQLEAKSFDGDTPLHSASWKGNVSAIEALAKKGAHLEAKNKDGDTPLHLATWNNSILAVKALIDYGADIHAKNNDGNTPLDLAYQKNNVLAIEVLSSAAKMKVVYAKAEELSKRIVAKSKQLISILSDYETYDVAHYELERCIRTLSGLKENSTYLGLDKNIDSAAIMLPSNLPLYSLVIFALVPSFLAQNVYVRPNTLLQECNLITRICDELELDTLFEQVRIINEGHAGFKQYIQNANLVVFTGKPSNADALVNEMKPGAVLVVNGSGHNPVVVTETADLDQAVEGTLLLKGFNGGQDCAGPDAILVHHAVAQPFIERFNSRFSSLRVGTFKEPETRIGPINRFIELQKFAQIFHTNSKDIVCGGMIDFKNNIVHPTTIIRAIERSPNFKEMFGPVAFIHPYKNDQDLSYYFQDVDGQYKPNRMYVTVYGHSDYIADRDDNLTPHNSGNVGIVLHNKTIHDVEIGYKPYGGYSLNASGIIKKTQSGIQKIAMPILIPEIISEYVIKGKDLPRLAVAKNIDIDLSMQPSIKRDKQIEPIVKAFQNLAIEVFGENLIFGFIFGSAAKGKLTVRGPGQDDLDTFICLKENDQIAVENYLKRLALLHHEYSLKVDGTFPAEIMTLESLEKTINSLGEIVVSVDKLITGKEFDRMFWAHALTDKKTGFIGNNNVMARLIKVGTPYIYTWKNQIIEQLEKKDTLPLYLCEKFSGLNKTEVIEKLSKYPAHLVVHLGLQYDEGTGS